METLLFKLQLLAICFYLLVGIYNAFRFLILKQYNAWNSLLLGLVSLLAAAYLFIPRFSEDAVIIWFQTANGICFFLSTLNIIGSVFIIIRNYRVFYSRNFLRTAKQVRKLVKMLYPEADIDSINLYRNSNRQYLWRVSDARLDECYFFDVSGRLLEEPYPHSGSLEKTKINIKGLPAKTNGQKIVPLWRDKQ